MDNISTTTLTDMTSQIGALELGDNLESHDDSMLDNAGSVSFGPTFEQCTVVISCPFRPLTTPT
jgi:hypothetical protein